MKELNSLRMENVTGGDCTRTRTTDVVGTFFAGPIYWIAVAIGGCFDDDLW